jgi:hypothetical protein
VALQFCVDHEIREYQITSAMRSHGGVGFESTCASRVILEPGESIGLPYSLPLYDTQPGPATISIGVAVVNPLSCSPRPGCVDPMTCTYDWNCESTTLRSASVPLTVISATESDVKR